ncbi:MAG: ABC transporter ATP-binding protein [Candidatus Marinimicrobia bacterium]|nr:ABC transporter ATP-binding protein [Candidatus Neomarinimicrobiota bacterium]MCF7829470.1 ABC transporter ATP-binding protein [Candidatus Neomarinimicrobiota bacterium]MCF7882349.1 ABC transporter ATP-binding protein [Candidatus Neomarinimicrobiota bacterium]
MTDQFAVDVRNLTKTFGKFTAVDHIDFSVEEGEIFGFLGANGAGKTTTIRMLTGILLPNAGEGQVSGFSIMGETEQIKQNIGYMSQKFSLYTDLTVRENLEFFGGTYGLSNSELAERIGFVTELYSIGNILDQITGSIPLGWKQRVGLASATIHDPRILFLDEPTSGVDPTARRHFWRTIYQLASREDASTVFVTTHYLEEAEYCDRVAIMHQGQILALDTPRNLKEEYNLSNMEDVFVRIIKEREEELAR